MKISSILSIVTLAVASAALGQGTVVWGPGVLPPPSIGTQTNDSQYSSFVDPFSSPLGGGQGWTAGASSGLKFDYALLYASFNGFALSAPTTMSQLIAQGWRESGLTATNSAVRGRLATVAGSTTATVPWAAGVTNNIMLVGWSDNLGSTWQVVSNKLANWTTYGGSFPEDTYAFFGMSSVGYIAPMDNTDPGAILFGTSANAQGLPIYSPDMQLYAVLVPEPGSFALASLGGLILLAFRRR